MKRDQFEQALAMYADADQRATASMIENVAAIVLLKLNPPARGDDVVEVTISAEDISQMAQAYRYEARYDGGEMTIFLTPL